MPVAMTYGTLVTDLQAYLQRTDATIVSQIPRFIMLAQQAVARDLRILGFREEITGTFDATAQSTGIMQKPADWRKTIAMWVGTGTAFDTHTPVYERTYEFVREVFPDPTIKGVPRFYADADWKHWLTLPAPNPALAPYFKIAYYGTLVFIDQTNQTNWLTENAPDWILYRSLMEAAGFVKTDERIPVWKQNYDMTTQSLLKQEMHGLIDRAASTTENG